ncbi:hypothetical protein [Chitinimonas koreensis]|uniref:hypothetical protein n=1 Tax=Chitinimonas koreensis TaxID=356302 RepID=UPI00165476DA|nr:hypothetical protein [Chitinimonas koreensis]QNM96213.1 hypothetical protein H9L41_20775 [Chitinimonas koreensis]
MHLAAHLADALHAAAGRLDHGDAERVDLVGRAAGALGQLAHHRGQHRVLVAARAGDLLAQVAAADARHDALDLLRFAADQRDDAARQLDARADREGDRGDDGQQLPDPQPRNTFGCVAVEPIALPPSSTGTEICETTSPMLSSFLGREM